MACTPWRKANREVAIGKRYGFGPIRDLDTFRARVAVHRYEGKAEEIHRMAAGEGGRLCGQRACLFEETAGSTGAAKLIPYTEQSLAAFRRALYPWLADLLHAPPGIRQGQFYWVISPAVRQRARTAGGIPIGVQDNGQYFGTHIAKQMTKVSVVPPAVVDTAEIEHWRYLTLRCLLEAENLRLISI